MSTPSATAEPIAVDTPTTAPTPTISQAVQGNLFLVERSGISRISLENGERKYLVRQEDNWVTFYAKFSPNGTFVVYWVETSTDLELWVSPLESWSPQLLIVVPESGYELVKVEWLATDHYVLLQLYREGHGFPGRVNSYLVNRENKQIESPAGWKGHCTIVAFSPQTNRLATWCPIEDEQDIPVAYTVVEESGELWFSEQLPEEILHEKRTDGEFWAWSVDRRYFAFSDYVGMEQVIKYADTDTGATKILSDRNTTYYDIVAVSPNNRYIAYYGNCADGLYCELVMDIEAEEVVWTSQTVSETAFPIIWSPDSRYFAVWVLEGIVIVDVTTGQVALQFEGVNAAPMLWLQEGDG